MDEDNHGLTARRPADREPTRAPADAALDETSVVEDADPITQLRERLKAMAAAEARMRAGPPPVARARPRVTDPEPVLERVERDREADDERRRQLWRDSATILIGVVLVLLIGQTFFPGTIGGPTGSPTPPPSTVSIGSFGPGTVGPPATLPPGATFGPVLNPSIPIDATPTPIPVITMGPTPTASPTPAPTRAPTPTRTPTPTRRPTPRPAATPPPPTAPPPTAPPPTAPPPTEPPPNP